jgi:hypothetical protein
VRASSGYVDRAGGAMKGGIKMRESKIEIEKNAGNNKKMDERGKESIYRQSVTVRCMYTQLLLAVGEERIRVEH